MAQIDWVATWQYILGQIKAFLDFNFWQELTAVFIGAFIALCDFLECEVGDLLVYRRD